MPFSHDTGIYNVQSSLVAWLQAQINADPPPPLDALILVLDHPDQPVHLPACRAFPGDRSRSAAGAGRPDRRGTGGAAALRADGDRLLDLAPGG